MWRGKNKMDKVPVRINDLGRKIRGEAFQENKPRRRSRAKATTVSVIAVVIVAGLVVAGLFLSKNFIGAQVDSSKYQAVFLTSGQVYFGKLNTGSGQYATLRDVFYIQASSSDDSQNPQDTKASVTDLQLIKLGNEVHGPEDEMIISRDQILFFENLKEDGKVTNSIEEYYEKQQ
jgi:hypothetical protein